MKGAAHKGREYICGVDCDVPAFALKITLSSLCQIIMAKASFISVDRLTRVGAVTQHLRKESILAIKIYLETSKTLCV